jgi:hypothetical protein
MNKRLWFGIIAPLILIIIIVVISAFRLQALVSSTPSLAEGLVAYYPEDGNHRDALGKHHGTLSGVSTPMEGIIGKSMHFQNTGLNGQGSSADPRVNTHFSDINSWPAASVSAWYYFDPFEYPGILWGFQEGGNYNEQYLAREAEGGLTLDTTLGVPNSASLTTTLPVSDNAWHHVVVIRDKERHEQLIYIDGNLAGTDAMPSGGFLSGEFWWGSWFNGYGYPHRVDEMGVWNRALSAEEVVQLYNNGTGLAYPFN